MKKYLLSLLVVGLTFIGFSNAYLEKVSCVEGFQEGVSLPCYIPDNFDKFVCNGNFDVTLNSTFGNLSTLYCPFSYDKDTLLGMIGNNRYYNPSDGLYLLIENGLPEPIIEGGNSNFTPVLTSISSSISEFIPYIVYIGLGILGALIGFYAIRWFINWLRKKIFSSFK